MQTTYTPEELKKILELHAEWLREAINGVQANLSGANLCYANLDGANLSRADLDGADLDGADLDGVKNFPPYLIVPESGSFECYKKVQNGVVLRLRIPVDAKRVNSTLSRKCRASKAEVLEAYGADEGQTQFVSTHDPDFIYRLGETVEVPDFDDDLREECTRGIHFFLTRAEAEAY